MKKDLSSPDGTNILQKFFAEFIGTYALVFFGCGSIMVAERFPGAIDGGAIPLIFGAAVAVMVYTVGHISGAHFNPAVTLAFTVARHFPKEHVFYYWGAQVGGGILAMAMLNFMLPHGEFYGATTFIISPQVAFLWEVVLTFFLMFVIMAVATDTKAVGIMAGVAIGLVVAIGAALGGVMTGASMNPARSLAPAIFEGTVENLWVYILAPMAGAVLGALAYQKIKCE